MTAVKDADIFECVARRIDPGARFVRAWQLVGGISAHMTAIELVFPDGHAEKLIIRRPGERCLRINPHAALHEFEILKFLQASAISAPKPHYLDQSGEIYSQTYSVIEYIEGKTEFAPPDIDEYTAQLASHLVQIHSLGGPELDLAFLPGQEERLARQFEKRPASLDHSLEEGRIRDILESAWPFKSRNEPVFLHGDFWPGNVLWRDGKIAGIIDWEDAETGDALLEIAITRLDLLMIFGLDAMEAFTSHYKALSGIDFANLPLWDLCAALRPASRIAEWAEGWPELGRSDISEQTMRAAHSHFVRLAFGSL